MKTDNKTILKGLIQGAGHLYIIADNLSPATFDQAAQLLKYLQGIERRPDLAQCNGLINEARGECKFMYKLVMLEYWAN